MDGWVLSFAFCNSVFTSFPLDRSLSCSQQCPFRHNPLTGNYLELQFHSTGTKQWMPFYLLCTQSGLAMYCSWSQHCKSKDTQTRACLQMHACTYKHAYCSHSATQSVLLSPKNTGQNVHHCQATWFVFVFKVTMSPKGCRTSYFFFRVITRWSR